MMVQCPKCGFTQPTDQFCASCGIDMHAFRPAQKSFFKRLVGNPLLQITLLVSSVGISYLTIRKQQSVIHQSSQALQDQDSQKAQTRQNVDLHRQKMQVSKPKDLASSGVHLASQSSEPSEPNPSLRQANNISVGGAPTGLDTDALPEKSQDGAPALLPTSNASASSSPLNGQSATAISQATSIRISFVEVNRALVSDLLSDSQNGGSIGSLYYGVVTNLESKAKIGQSAGGWTEADSSSPQTIRINQPIIVYKGTRDIATGQNLGLTVQVTPTGQDENGTSIQVDVYRALRETSTASGVEELNLPLPDGFVVPRGSSLILSGVMPRKNLLEAEERVYRSVNVLRPLTSENFRTGVSDFLIHIDLK